MSGTQLVPFPFVERADKALSPILPTDEVQVFDAAGTWQRRTLPDGRIRTIDTIVALQALTTPSLRDGDVFHVLRYSTSHTMGEGSDNVVRYVAASTETVDGVFVFTGPGVGRFVCVDQSEVNAKKAGAVGNGTADDTTAVNACLAKNRGVYFPVGTYKITSSLTIPVGFSGELKGEGPNTVILNAIVANPANPLIRIGEDVVFVGISNLDITGNGLSGASGNGHAIALIDTVGGAFSPQRCKLERVTIRDHRGNGKDYLGNSIAAAGVYAYGALNNTARHVLCVNCNHGWYLDATNRFEMSEMSGASLCAISGITVRAGAVHTVINGCDFTDNGTAGAGNGNVILHGVNQAAITNSRIKSGTPYNIDAAPTTAINSSVLIIGNSFSNVVTGDNTAIVIGNGSYGVSVRSNLFEYANAVTSAVPIDCVQAVGGFELTGLEVIGNHFTWGQGMTIPAVIRTNVTSDKVRAPRIAGNTIGSYSAAGSATTFTTGINVAGNVTDAKIEDNVFVAGPNWIISTAINIAAGATGTVLGSNAFVNAGGTLTTQVANAGSGSSTIALTPIP